MFDRAECLQGDHCGGLEEFLAGEGKAELVDLIAVMEYHDEDLDGKAEEWGGW